MQVLSGTESGTILVWDDALIKCQLKRPGGPTSMCHDGMIEYLHLDEDIRQMTSAAADGYIRFWNLDVHVSSLQIFEYLRLHKRKPLLHKWLLFVNL